MRILALLLCLVWCDGWAATTYLNTSCAKNGNGASGACAAIAGGAGAFNSGLSVFWSTIGAGNTLYIARGTTVSQWAGIIIDTAVTVDDYGTGACPVWTAPVGTYMISVSADNVTINDICVTGNASSALISTTKANTALNRITAYSNSGSGIGIRFNNGSSNGSLTDSTVYDIYDDGVGIGATATGTFTITNLDCYRIDRANGTGDCIQAYVGTPANLTIVGGTYRKETPVKQAIIYDGSGAFTMRGLPKFYNKSGGPNVAVWGTGTVDIDSMFCLATAGASCLFLNTTGTTDVRNLILIGADYGIWSSHASGTTTIRNATIIGSHIAAVYATTGGTLNIKDSYLDAPRTLWQATSAATVVADYNRYGRAVFGWNGAEITSFATWKSTSSQDTNSAVAAETFAGGTAPNSVEGVRLAPSSTMKCAGTSVGRLADALDRGYEPNCTPIGAMLYGRGDARTTALSPRP